ncbi:MAG: hypothetical protein NT169_18055 [Chloroflexi bacterium]|nr:hypothetical protein [Chloroflexota bacterium]
MMARKLKRVGFHWRATFQHDNVRDWDLWLAEMAELGIGTLFICHDASGMRHYDPITGTLDPNRIPRDAHPGIEGLVRDLLSIGVEPALRLSDVGGIRPGAIPNRVLDGLAKAGVKHVQVWNEPNDDREWRNSKVPADWQVKSIEWALPACRYGLSIGLEMALPPINPGVDVNQFQIAVDLGAGDLFEKGLGVNIHLYPFNRLIWKGKPYPFDDVNQHGEQLTEEEYAGLDRWYWHGFPREHINQLRRDQAKPGCTIMDDCDNFMGWLVHEQHMKKTLGPNAAVPCRVTEMGPRPWQDLDKRYPRLTPQEHARQVALICRWFEGEATIGGYRRPDWLKAGYFWIMGGVVMGDYSQVFEADAYYSDWNMDRRPPECNYPQAKVGHMPAVDTIKQLAAEPPADSTLAQVAGHVVAAQGYLRDARGIVAGL